MKEATKRDALARRTSSNQNGKNQSKPRRRVGDAELMVYAKEYELEINDHGATKEECAPWRVSISDLQLLRLLSLLDRLLHHAVVVQIEGASYRLRAHADLIPEHVRANAPITPPPPPKRRGRPPKKELEIQNDG